MTNDKRTETHACDLISRQAALTALRTCYDTNLIVLDNGDELIHYGDAVGAIEALPSAQPTLYGYSIESLVAVAEIMKKGGMSPEEALWTYKNNVQRIAELIRAEWYENVQKQLEHVMFEGEQE